ncbi:uncharacterized protein PY17X_1217000 [Plasmodium yoelii]|uniref:RMI1 domain-containing protein n=3 Tax=Plasmodium yoelii TaxID=5861 RepID=A0AAF0B1Q0_PLAYO|nr:uncharacterized protein PY17X_1217000 [Plasmodium yoelii]EAA16507.1 homeobox-containing protein [Plasmodium yoelii yoelii]WBY59172.1 RMI1 domain-containing protein [Plasmodium yoelii yoelii]CDU19336.1 conserved Plasmodium protein, unknown function [Plasmodium yoelii]VTZ79971.1 conserved Plasmodium protein, unknown function [Plasmodium yoelii]|eukprot:XP_724942.1 uncharacterized protein PY17X_1217000 [Plasmodium yoelii]
MKKLIEKNVIKINYNTFVNQYKKAFKCEKDIIDEELYEHFIINPFTYSRPFGCLLPNYNNTEKYYLNGINIFEIVDYVTINERLYKFENSGDNNDDSDQNEEDFTNLLGNSENEDIIDYSNSEVEYGNGNKKGIKNKKSNKNNESMKNKGYQKTANNNMNNNNNFTTQVKKCNNKYRRIFRFLLFDGKYFIYAYEYEFNENFNYLETNKYKYPKIILYNNPVIRRKVILLKKNQVIILFKGNTTIEQNNSNIKDEEIYHDIVNIVQKKDELIPISTKNESNYYNLSGSYNMSNQNRNHNDDPNYLSRENNIRHFYYENEKFKNTYTNSAIRKDEQNYNYFTNQQNNNNNDKYKHFKSCSPLKQVPNIDEDVHNEDVHNKNAHNKNVYSTNAYSTNFIQTDSTSNNSKNNNQLIDLTEGFFSSKFFQKSPDISNICNDVIILDD